MLACKFRWAAGTRDHFAEFLDTRIFLFHAQILGLR